MIYIKIVLMCLAGFLISLGQVDAAGVGKIVSAVKVGNATSTIARASVKVVRSAGKRVGSGSFSQSFTNMAKPSRITTTKLQKADLNPIPKKRSTPSIVIDNKPRLRATTSADATHGGHKLLHNRSWEGPYGNLRDHPSIGGGKYFSQTAKQRIYSENRLRNRLALRDDVTGRHLQPGVPHKRGVKPPHNEAQIDHMIPSSKGGTNSSSNAQVLGREHNIRKGNKNSASIQKNQDITKQEANRGKFKSVKEGLHPVKNSTDVGKIQANIESAKRIDISRLSQKDKTELGLAIRKAKESASASKTRLQRDTNKLLRDKKKLKANSLSFTNASTAKKYRAPEADRLGNVNSSTVHVAKDPNYKGLRFASRVMKTQDGSKYKSTSIIQSNGSVVANPGRIKGNGYLTGNANARFSE